MICNNEKLYLARLFRSLEFWILALGSGYFYRRRFECTKMVFWTHFETLLESVLKEQWVRVVCVLKSCWMRVGLLLNVCYACAAPPPQEQIQPPVEALPNGTSVTVFQCNRWNCSYWPCGTSEVTWMAIEADSQLSVLQWKRLKNIWVSIASGCDDRCLLGSWNLPVALWSINIWKMQCDV